MEHFEPDINPFPDPITPPQDWPYEDFEEEDDETSYVIAPDSVGDVEVNEITDDYVSLSQKTPGENGIYIALDWTPEADQIADLVERSMEDLKGESLTRVIEVVVKKLNKLRSFIESIKGL